MAVGKVGVGQVSFGARTLISLGSARCTGATAQEKWQTQLELMHISGVAMHVTWHNHNHLNTLREYYHLPNFRVPSASPVLCVWSA